MEENVYRVKCGKVCYPGFQEKSTHKERTGSITKLKTTKKMDRKSRSYIETFTSLTGLFC